MSDRWMRRALALARRGQGWVEPNPMVGAVMVRGGRVVAEGFHEGFGAPHAEVNVLQKCREKGIDPSGCDLFVSLEPCGHHGKTPPCCDAILDARIERVFAAMVDPNPAVSGAGIERLRQAGVRVETGTCGQQAQQLNEPYVKRVTTGRPWVIAKWAQTLDGRIATRTGHSRWISNAGSRRAVHRLRARVDAIVVGIGTVLADNPLLTAREVKVRRLARRVVVDPQGRLPLSAQLLQTLTSSLPLTVAVAKACYAAKPAHLTALANRGVELIGLPCDAKDSSRLDLVVLMEHLAKVHGATNVMVEGGSKLISTLWRQQLLDQVLAFVGPKVLGDDDAVPVVQDFTPEAECMDQASTLRLHLVKRIGDDVLLDYRTVFEGVVPARFERKSDEKSHSGNGQRTTDNV